MKDTEKFKFAIYKILDKKGIIDELSGHLELKGYEKVACYNSKQILFISKGEPESPSWKPFLEKITPSPSILELLKRNPSFVLLNLIDVNCYAITGGSGHFHINQFIEEDFGLDAISRIVESDRIKLIRQAAFAGKISQLERIFKEFYNYNFDTSNWGKLTKEIIGEIDKNLFNELFNISGGKSRAIKLAGTSSFWISRSVTHEELNALLNKLHRIHGKQQKIPLFSGYHHIRDNSLIEALDEQLINNIEDQYDRFSVNPNAYMESNINISYTDAKELLLCDKYSINLPACKSPEIVETLDLPTLFQALIDKEIVEFKHYYLSQLKIVGLDNDGQEKNVRGSLKKFLYAEISYDDTSYYLVDGKWYQITDEFQKEIEEKAKKLILNYSNPSFSLPSWKGGITTRTEPEYITEICANNIFVKMHGDNIRLHTGRDKAELCDVISLRDGVHLIFVKRGTGSSLRELFAQTRVSVELFEKDESFRKEAISKAHKNSRYIKLKKIPFNDYSVVLAINDKSINRNHKPLESKLSTLAKLDLINCVNYLKNELGIDRIIVYEIKYEKLAKPFRNVVYA